MGALIDSIRKNPIGCYANPLIGIKESGELAMVYNVEIILIF
jgi:hypothetical protein